MFKSVSLDWKSSGFSFKYSNDKTLSSGFVAELLWLLFFGVFSEIRRWRIAQLLLGAE